jgi:single-strand DNA-binding protein
MNAFTLIAVGNLARDPEINSKDGKSHTRLCLVGNDYVGRDEDGNAREAVTTAWFVAFNGIGEAIAKNARKGDQLIIHARIRANNWTDDNGKPHYDHSYQVETFRFGAPGRVSRAQLQRQEEAPEEEYES